MAALELPSLTEIEALLRRVVREELGRLQTVSPELVPMPEAARRLGVSLRTVQRGSR